MSEDSIDESLSKIAQQRNIPGTEIIKRFNESVKLFEANQLEQARKGFLEVSRSGIMVSDNGKTAEDYLAQIDKILLQRAQKQITPEVPADGNVPAIKEVPQLQPEPKTKTPAAPDTKQNLLRSYSKAVVNDALIKVQEEISQGNYEKARQSIKETMQVLNENKENLGEELFQQYIGDLEQLTSNNDPGEDRPKTTKSPNSKKLKTCKNKRQKR